VGGAGGGAEGEPGAMRGWCIWVVGWVGVLLCDCQWAQRDGLHCQECYWHARTPVKLPTLVDADTPPAHPDYIYPLSKHIQDVHSAAVALTAEQLQHSQVVAVRDAAQWEREGVTAAQWEELRAAQEVRLCAVLGWVGGVESTLISADHLCWRCVVVSRPAVWCAAARLVAPAAAVLRRPPSAPTHPHPHPQADQQLALSNLRQEQELVQREAEVAAMKGELDREGEELEVSNSVGNGGGVLVLHALITHHSAVHRYLP